jgi:hypothetical protein
MKTQNIQITVIKKAQEEAKGIENIFNKIKAYFTNLGKKYTLPYRKLLKKQTERPVNNFPMSC